MYELLFYTAIPERNVLDFLSPAVLGVMASKNGRFRSLFVVFGFYSLQNRHRCDVSYAKDARDTCLTVVLPCGRSNKSSSALDSGNINFFHLSPFQKKENVRCDRFSDRSHRSFLDGFLCGSGRHCVIQ
jgi:hypothetical protein